MNSKKINIVLIIAVAIVWGVVIYRYFFQTASAVTNFNTLAMVEKKDFVNFERKEFELAKLKRDPFLGRTYSSVHSSSGNKNSSKKRDNKKRKKQLPKRTKRQFEYIPEVQYLGFVQNKKNPTKLVLLKVEGETQIIKEKTDYKDLFYVKKAYRDSVEIVINKTIKFIKKEK